MTRITLRAYNRELEGLIDRGQRLDEVIAHCRHILGSYPKHLETYRLLGKAFLETKRYEEAVEVFQRVILAVPEDFVSHVGMSVIADDQGRLDDAIWHMERAFEVQPSNAAIQGELQRLFARRDGVEPPRIRLTRGALAHMYVQGGLYNQAVAEIRAVLGHESKRTDMLVLLAKAYFRNGQVVEATDVCTELLTRYPYCQDANRLMVEILAGTQHASDQYRQRVNELDPYARFAKASVFQTETVEDRALVVERLNWTGQPVANTIVPDVGLEPGPAAEPTVGRRPSWLVEAQAEKTAADSGLQPKDDIPAFLRRAGRGPVSSRSPTPSMPQAEEPQVLGHLPPWADADVSPDSQGPTRRSGELPDGGDGVPQLAGIGGFPTLGSDFKDIQQKGIPVNIEDLNQQELGDSLAVSDAEKSIAGEVASTLEWPGTSQPEDGSIDPGDRINDPDRTPKVSIPESSLQKKDHAYRSLDRELSENLGSMAPRQDDAVAWLESLATQPEKKSEDIPNAQTETPETTPDWLTGARPFGEIGDASRAPQSLSSSESPEKIRDDSTDVLMKNSAGNDNAHNGHQGDSMETGHSLPFPGPDGVFQRGDLSERIQESMHERSSTNEVHDAPEWPKTTRPPEIGEVPGWLSSSSSRTRAGEARQKTDITDETDADMDLPDWLAGLDTEGPWSPGISTNPAGLPPWPQPEAASGPESAQRARLNDWRPIESGSWSEVPQSTPSRVSGVIETAGTAESSYLGVESSPKVTAPLLESSAAGLRSASGPSRMESVSLAGAQSELGRGNIAAALDIYGRLIRKGKSLEDIIRDLRDALYRYPVEVSILQALGDAYMRANRLQEALDAYTKAEELLR